jgi:hypothetical protein
MKWMNKTSIHLFKKLLIEFFMYIITNCYQLVTDEAIWFWNFDQLVLANKTLSELIC